MPIIQDTAGNTIQDTAGLDIVDTAGLSSVQAGLQHLNFSLNSVSIGIVQSPGVACGLQSLSFVINPAVGVGADAGDAVALPNRLLLDLQLFGARAKTDAEVVSATFRANVSQLKYSPVRKFYIGTSDYSDRVVKWPTIKRTAYEVKSSKINISLANNDGALNQFYDQTYSLVNTVSLQIIDEYEELDVFKGYVSAVKYDRRQCIIEARDRLWDLTQRKIGDSDEAVHIPSSGGVLISDLAWTLCTCYGGMSSVKSSSNVDIDWADYQDWSNQISSNNIFVHGYYDGMKLHEALTDLGQYTDSAVIVHGDGKVHFKKFEEVSSYDHTWEHDKIIELGIDVTKKRLVNKQWVNWDYSIESDYYTGKVYAQDTTSVNTFGIYEDIIERESIWYVDSPSALTMAQRQVALFALPPKVFEIETGLDGVWREVGETARFVDSFYNVTSGAGWRIMERHLDLNAGTTKIFLDAAVAFPAFYLDVSTLDSSDRLL